MAGEAKGERGYGGLKRGGCGTGPTKLVHDAANKREKANDVAFCLGCSAAKLVSVLRRRLTTEIQCSRLEPAFDR